MNKPPSSSGKAAGTLPPGCRDPQWLGDGKDGKVYKVTRSGGMTAALKVIRLRNGVAEGLKEFKFILGIRPHRNIIAYQEVYLRTADNRLLDPTDDLDRLDESDLEGMDLLILMQLAQGTLAGVLRDRSDGLPTEELLGYVGGAADGLDHLHKPVHNLGGVGVLSRVVHRDVKPANLLLVDGEVKVADYGVARADGGAKATKSIACTPEYAPPEVYTNEPVPQSDQYSLAVTYYELRTGRLPFDGAAIAAHMQGRLDFRGVDAAEQAVLRRATSYQIGKRFPNCREFADALWAANGLAAPRTSSGAIPTPGPRIGRPAAPGEQKKTVAGTPGRTDPELPQFPEPPAVAAGSKAGPPQPAKSKPPAPPPADSGTVRVDPVRRPPVRPPDDIHELPLASSIDSSAESRTILVDDLPPRPKAPPTPPAARPPQPAAPAVSRPPAPAPTVARPPQPSAPPAVNRPPAPAPARPAEEGRTMQIGDAPPPVRREPLRPTPSTPSLEPTVARPTPPAAVAPTAPAEESRTMRVEDVRPVGPPSKRQPRPTDDSGEVPPPTWQQSSNDPVGLMDPPSWRQPTSAEKKGGGGKLLLAAGVAGLLVAAGVGYAVFGGKPPVADGTTKSTGDGTTPPVVGSTGKKVEPPPRDYGKDLADAREQFVRAATEYTAIAAGLEELKPLLADGTPVEFRTPATALNSAWTAAKADGENPPTEADRQRLKQRLAAVPQLLADSDDQRHLRAFYNGLLGRLPIPEGLEQLLAEARKLFEADKLADGLGKIKPGTDPAWDAARRLHRPDTAPVAVDELIAACKGTHPPSGTASAIDKVLPVYYQRLLPKLAGQFIKHPADPQKLTGQTVIDLQNALNGVTGVMSPVLDLLKRDCELLRRFGDIGKVGAAGPAGPAVAVAADPLADPVLAAFERLLTAAEQCAAATAGNRATAADGLVLAVQGLGDNGQKLLIPGWRRAVCRLLVEKARPDLGTGTPPAPDLPYKDMTTGPKSARDWFKVAVDLVEMGKGFDDPPLAAQVRSELLVAAAWSEPDAKLWEKAAAKATDLGEKVSPTVWLAFARTRTLPAQLADAATGYKEVVKSVTGDGKGVGKDGKPVLTADGFAFVKRLAKPDGHLMKTFADAVKGLGEAKTASEAAEGVFAKLARAAFVRRPLKVPAKPADDSEVMIARRLAERAADLTVDPVIKALAGLIALESGERNRVADHVTEAGALKDAAPGKSAPLVYLGFALFVSSDAEPDQGEKLDVLTTAVGHLATVQTSTDEPELLTLVHRTRAICNIHRANFTKLIDPSGVAKLLDQAAEAADELRQITSSDPRVWDIIGSVSEDQAWLTPDLDLASRTKKYRAAQTAFEKADQVKGVGLELSRTHARLHLGRCLQKWATSAGGSERTRLLGLSKTALDNVIEQGEPSDQAEARYWAAMGTLLAAKLTDPQHLVDFRIDDPATPYPKAVMAAAEEYLAPLRAIPKNDPQLGKWRVRGLEWAAAAAYAQAEVSDERAAREAALQALDELAEEGGFRAGLWRSSFALARLQKNPGAVADPQGELDGLLKELNKTALPATPAKVHLQHEEDQARIYARQVRARSLNLPVLNLPDPAVRDHLAAAVTIGRKHRSGPAISQIELERLGQDLTVDANRLDPKSELRRKTAQLAARSMTAAAELIPGFAGPAYTSKDANGEEQGGIDAARCRYFVYIMLDNAKAEDKASSIALLTQATQILAPLKGPDVEEVKGKVAAALKLLGKG